MGAQPDVDSSPISSRATRRQRIVAAAASVALMCCCVTSCTRTQIGLSAAAVAAVVVGTTVGVTLAIQHSHHTLQGCIFDGSNGPELRLGDSKTYILKGQLADIKVGDRLKIHGSTIKKVKGDSSGRRVFVVEKVNKDYGPCPASVGRPQRTGKNPPAI